MAEYKNPELLVSTDWVLENKDKPGIKIVESNEDILLYDIGHIEGAIKLDWETELQDSLIRDYVNKENFEKLMSSKGISPEDTIVFYGDKSNWWACYALWTFKIYGHAKCLIMNGGRQKWVQEDKPVTRDVPASENTNYKVSDINLNIRAFREEVKEHSAALGSLIDVRSPKEFSGEMLHMEAYPQEGALRGGHIPNAKSVPWATAANEDGTFKSADELLEIYQGGAGLKPEDDVIAYCSIKLFLCQVTQLLAYKNVKNYDGSWTEWGMFDCSFEK